MRSPRLLKQLLDGFIHGIDVFSIQQSLLGIIVSLQCQKNGSLLNITFDPVGITLNDHIGILQGLLIVPLKESGCASVAVVFGITGIKLDGLEN